MLNEEGVWLLKDGRFELVEFPDENARANENKNGEIKYNLDKRIFLENGITLETVLNSFYKENIFQMLSYVPENFKNYMSELDKAPIDDKEIEKLEVNHHLNYFDHDKVSTDFGDSFYGIGYPLKEDDPHGVLHAGDRSFYSLSLTPLNAIKNLSVSINRKLEFNILKKENENLKIFIVPSEEDNFFPSVFDFINTIMYELTWYGDVSERDEFSESLIEQAKKENIIKSSTIDIDELLRDINKKK